MSDDLLLEVRGLRIGFEAAEGQGIRAVDGLDFQVRRGRTLGIVGESGCGKSVTALSVMGLLPKDGARVDGEIIFAGRNLREAGEAAMRDLRGNRMAMIFQEPMTSLNPSFTIGDQIVEVLRRHKGLDTQAARVRAIEMLRLVRIPNPEQRIDDFPHRLSGGMRQRAMIAMALACNPELVIADEPTTALDVTIQAQILELLRALRERINAGVVLITHDLGVVAEVCDDVLVMYAGQAVEFAPVDSLFRMPQHPYTLGLLGSLPRLDARRGRLAAIEGSVPDMRDPPTGCRFAERCPFAEPECRSAPVALADLGDGRMSRCRLAPLERLDT